MTPPDIMERTRRAVREVFIERPWDLADLKPETTFASLDFDSLDMVGLAFALESEFEGLTVRDADSENWKTFGDVVRFLESAMEGAA
jgi:acyl carrier protein